MKKAIFTIIVVAFIVAAVSLAFETSSFADNHTDVKGVAEEINERGNFGRIVIEELDINVAVFFSDDADEFQAISDAEDSACMFDWADGNRVITDHNYQGFGAMVGGEASTMQIVTGSEVQEYRCIERIQDGRNDGGFLTYKNGKAIGDKGENTIVIYTCKNDGIDGKVVITVWEKC